MCGENLAMSSGSLSLAAGTRMWIEEKYNYKGEKMGSGRDSMWGHYTEVRIVLFLFKASISSAMLNERFYITILIG